MRKYVEITEMVERVAFLNPEKSECANFMLKLSGQNVKPGAKDIFYITIHEDGFDDLEKIEPGDYVTVLHHVDNIIEKEDVLFIKVSDIYINDEVTQKRRTQFDYYEYEDDEGAFHKVINEMPYHVSDTNFMLSKA